MTLLSADRISKRFNTQVILDRVSFTITTESRIGVVGKNGIGKTTLFELLAGEMEPDSGVVTRSKGCRIEYVEQEKGEYESTSLFAYVISARPDILALRDELDEAERQMIQHPDDPDRVMAFGEIQHRHESIGGFDLEQRAKMVLTGLGFPEPRYTDLIGQFSGGEKNRAGLARLLLGSGNLLLLDEPTNHLDIASTSWLESYLRSSERAYLVISHDRAFLTAVADSVWEISYGQIESYTGGFNRYLIERTERREQLAHRYAHQQAEIKRIEEFIRRNMAGQKTKQAQSRLKYLGRIERLPQPRSDAASLSQMVLKSSGRSFNHVLSLENVTAGYGRDAVVRDVSFDLYRGDKAGLIGRNGAGKSTILKTLVGELTPDTGHIKLGSQVDVAYFDQELGDLDLMITVLDNLWECDPMAPVERMRSFLARFGFTGDDPFKLTSALSGGEKTKLALARLLYHPANLIIFDEPTNHLDIDARETLEEALREYDGTCVIVSHDRYFLDQVTNKILHLENGTVRTYGGSYSYFVEKQATVDANPKVESKNERTDPTSMNSYLASKERSRREKRRKTELQQSRTRIEELETELATLEVGLQGGIPKTDWEKLHRASRRKEEVETEMLELYDKITRLEQEADD